MGKDSDGVEVLRANEALMGIEKKPSGFQVEWALRKMGRGTPGTRPSPTSRSRLLLPSQHLQRFRPLSQQWAGACVQNWSPRAKANIF